jgi:cytochrome c oxidase subunit 4
MTQRPIASLVLAWAALLALLALTLGSAYVALGPSNVAINYLIALAKAAIVMVCFMHVGRSGSFVRVVAAAGVVWLIFLGALGLTDYATRGPADAPRTDVTQRAAGS